MKTPSLATLYKLAAVYGVNVCELLPSGDFGWAVLPTVVESDTPTKKASAWVKAKKK